MRKLGMLILGLMPLTLYAVDSIYCPQNHAYIQVGMTTAQVIAACGNPISKETSNKPIMRQIPITQLYYNNQGEPKAFYGVWEIPGGNSRPGKVPFGDNTGGVQLQV